MDIRRGVAGATWMLVLCWLVPGPAPGQSPDGMISPQTPAPPARVVQAKPYSMTQQESTEQTFGNGLAITSARELHRYRDSGGNTRADTQRWSAGSGSSDPRGPKYWTSMVQGTGGSMMMTWSSQPGAERVARVNHFGPMPSGDRIPFPEGANRDQSTKASNKRENLGEKTIQGIAATGTRFTTTYPRESIGNNLEFTTVRESWMANGYDAVVESMTEDPRSGKRVVTLTSFIPGEPDPAMFLPPEGYRVLDPEKH